MRKFETHLCSLPYSYKIFPSLLYILVACIETYLATKSPFLAGKLLAVCPCWSPTPLPGFQEACLLRNALSPFIVPPCEDLQYPPIFIASFSHPVSYATFRIIFKQKLLNSRGKSHNPHTLMYVDGAKLSSRGDFRSDYLWSAEIMAE